MNAYNSASSNHMRGLSSMLERGLGLNMLASSFISTPLLAKVSNLKKSSSCYNKYQYFFLQGCNLLDWTGQCAIADSDYVKPSGGKGEMCMQMYFTFGCKA